ncbi:MAG TPA: hypothetical protein VLA76_07220 [Candidatus Angelobacter sp.]|nr:hypothetical protein [Candidatus Angelobacter sp.]
MSVSLVPSMARRVLRAGAVALLGVALGVTAVAANEPSPWLLPEDDAGTRIPALVPAPLAAPATPEPAPTPRPRPMPSPRPTPTPTPTPAPTPANDGIGYDISYPQCGDAWPESFAFAIVGVNGGRVHNLNPCFGPSAETSQLEWAGRDAQLYFNTGNPGPRISRYWPTGQDDPRTCDQSSDADSADCSFLYGWNAAEFAHGAALEAYIDLGWLDPEADRLPADTMIWLDVEPANSWRRDRSLNVASLEGAVAYLESVGAERIGFYSTPRLWNRITGGTDRFAGYPAWHAGARDRADAERRCAEERSFTGGPLEMVQWVENGLDHNVRCEDADPSS